MRAPSRSTPACRRATAWCRRAPRSASMPPSPKVSRANITSASLMPMPIGPRSPTTSMASRIRRASPATTSRSPPWRTKYWTPSARSRSTTPTSRSASPRMTSARWRARSAICTRPRSCGRTRAGECACAAQSSQPSRRGGESNTGSNLRETLTPHPIPLPMGEGADRACRNRSAGPGEGDFVEGAGAEPFGGAGHRLAAERPIEADGRLVVRERPDHQALQPALHQVAPRRGEQLAAEAEALEFRPQVELVDFAVVIQAARAVAPVIGITGHAFAECQHHDPAAFANRAVPPCRAAPVDQLVELWPRNDALIRTPPGFVVRRGDGRSIGRLGAADFDQGRVHDLIQASTPPRFKSYI